MDFAWDERKSARNAVERGLPFALAMALFEGPVALAHDVRRDYGEPRIRAIGAVDNVVLACVFTDRDGVRRIISLRRANRKERDAYRTFGAGPPG